MSQDIYESHMLFLINRARTNPSGEAKRYGINLGNISSTPKSPLIENKYLTLAAEKHSQWMINTGKFSHTGVNGSNPGQRMKNAGYIFSGTWRWGENIAWRGTTGIANPIEMAEAAHAALFRSQGHRENILNVRFKEIGIGIILGRFGKYNAEMITQDFGLSSGSKPQYVLSSITSDRA